jgi:GNAT superfamily N-acetyltransferase
LVDAEYRSRGIGKALMNFAENFLAMTVAEADECRMVATTFSALEEANAFYKSRNYDCVEEKMVGKMLMNTYEKVIIKSDT